MSTIKTTHGIPTTRRRRRSKTISTKNGSTDDDALATRGLSHWIWTAVWAGVNTVLVLKLLTAAGLREGIKWSIETAFLLTLPAPLPPAQMEQVVTLIVTVSALHTFLTMTYRYSSSHGART
jgi:hypothetical protein